jgi:hypothetical protein
MPADDDDLNLIDQIQQLTDEAKVALLKAIKASAEHSGNIEKLAHAYALVVGAKTGVLPNGQIAG